MHYLSHQGKIARFGPIVVVVFCFFLTTHNKSIHINAVSRKQSTACSGCGGPVRSLGPSTPTQPFQEYFAQNAGTAVHSTHTNTHTYRRALCCNLKLRRERPCHCSVPRSRYRGYTDRIRTHTRSLPLCKHLHNSHKSCRVTLENQKCYWADTMGRGWLKYATAGEAIPQRCHKCLHVKYLSRLVPVLWTWTLSTEFLMHCLVYVYDKTCCSICV